MRVVVLGPAWSWCRRTPRSSRSLRAAGDREIAQTPRAGLRVGPQPGHPEPVRAGSRVANTLALMGGSDKIQQSRIGEIAVCTVRRSGSLNRHEVMHDQISSVVFTALSAVFAGYGVSQLKLAYKVTAWAAWSDRAVTGAAGILAAALFVMIALRVTG